MVYEREIANEEKNIIDLTNQSRVLRLPARTISWQHQNKGVYPRGITRNVRIVRRDRLAIRKKIDASRIKIKSLREAILGI